MKTKVKLIYSLFAISFLLLMFSCEPQQQTIQKSTFTYSIKGSDTLQLDMYNNTNITGEKPCVLFMFGGGFMGGSKSEDNNVAYMHKLAEKGYMAVAIDYRLGLKDIAPEQLGNMSHFAKLLYNAVNIAVEDLFDATNYVYDNASSWGIKKDLIIASGSSAGAISVLQGIYYISNKHPEFINKLPEGFNYAGVISFAGAILAGEELVWSDKPSPSLLFHGNADSNVPYDKVLFGPVGMFGSKAITASLDSLEAPYYFCSFNNKAHEIASTPMVENVEEIDLFIQRYVVDKQEKITLQHIRKANEKEFCQQFEISDFIRSNFQ